MHATRFQAVTQAFRRYALPALALIVSACSGNPDQRSLYDNVGQAFAECNPAEIRWMTEKHELMPAFKYCGSNNIRHFAWNPAGTLLYFDLPMTSHLIDASLDHKPLYTLPFPTPVGSGAWISDTRLVVPVGPNADDEAKRERIGLYDTFQQSIEFRRISGLTGITDLAHGRTASEVLFTANNAAGTREVYALDLDDGSVKQAFPWLSGQVDTFTFTRKLGVAVVGLGQTVTVYRVEDGTSLGSWSPASRGTVHPGGRWLALEHEGEEVSVFYQRTWDELSERARKIEEQKAQRLESRLPDWYPKRVRLPTVSMVDLESGKRWAIRSFYGTRFAWYEARDFYGSFLLWGFEGKSLNRNVLLGNMAARLYAMEHGTDRQDVRAMTSSTAQLPRAESALGTTGDTGSAGTDPAPPGEKAAGGSSGEPPAQAD